MIELLQVNDYKFFGKIKDHSEENNPEKHR